MKQSSTWLVVGVLMFGGYILNACKSPLYQEGKSVKDELASFQVTEGFEVINIAAEPLIQMPMAVTMDEAGTLYTIEMADYPFIADINAGKGVIKRLFDRDEDGVYDSAAVFIDRVADITSALPYKGGLIITAAPNILYLKDTDGDDRADLIDTLYSGFFTGNSEAQITNLTYGLDNWIYANNHGQAGKIVSHRGDRRDTLLLGGFDFRFQPETGAFEAETGTGQFGLALNDWNHRFYTQNTLHIQTNPIPKRYLYRHAHLPSYKGDYNPSDHELRMFQLSKPPHWRVERSNRRQEQYDALGLNQTEWIEGHFTGASGATFYGGENFPAEYYGSIFTGEVAGNLIHRDVLHRPDTAVLYTASRGGTEQNKEFLATEDAWFRPTTFYSGPDGNLIVVDMYRQHIETPLSIPEDLMEDMDFAAGNAMGRLWLIYPTGKRNQVQVNLASASPAELVTYLAHAGAWWRTNAQRLLVERQDQSVVPAVGELLLHADARVRLRAAYTLQGLGRLTPDQILLLLGDADANVREHGIKLAEAVPSLREALRKGIADPAKFVVFQAALSLGNGKDAEVRGDLARLLVSHPSDSMINLAVLTAPAVVSVDFVDALVGQGYFAQLSDAKRSFLSGWAFAIGAKNELREWKALTSHMESQGLLAQTPVLAELVVKSAVEGFKKRKYQLDDPVYREFVKLSVRYPALAKDELMAGR